MAIERRLTIVDPDGFPFSPRIDQALRGLSGRLRRKFPHLREEMVLAEVLEEAGRRIVLRERLRGELANLHGYAWVTARSVAVSSLRRSSRRMESRMIAGKSGEISLTTASASSNAADQIEWALLWDELLRLLKEEDRQLFELKQEGFSSAEIARRQGRSVAAVDTSYFRAKARIRALFAGWRTGR